MADDQGRASSTADVALWLESSRQQLLEDYERSLLAKRSRMVVDQNSRQQASDHAKAIIADVVNRLGVESALAANDSTAYLAGDVGARRALDNMHPVESVHAAGEFFRVVMTAMVRIIPAENDYLLVRAILALNQGISAWIRESAVSYNGFLLDKIYRAHVDERRHLARELHDRVGAGLSLAHRQLDLQDMCRRTAPDLADQRVAAAHEAIIEAMDEIREVTSDLRLAEPPEDLARALHDYLDSAALGDVTAQVIVNGDESWVTPRIREEAFLIIRESVRNALAHGNCRTILVRINIAPHELRGAIDDDGKGFNSGEHPRRAGTGLTFMHERVALLDGLFEVSSKPGSGTRVEFLIPLRGEQDGRTS